MADSHITQRTFWSVIPIVVAITISISGFLYAEVKDMRVDRQVVYEKLSEIKADIRELMVKGNNRDDILTKLDTKLDKLNGR